MTTTEAIAICESWFAYIERQKQRSVRMQQLATLARSGSADEARRQMRQLDQDVTVYDGARLEPAVRFLVDMARTAART